MFFFRRAVYAAVFVLLPSMPSVQIAFASFTAVSMMIYVTVVRPYDSVLSTFLAIVNECLLVAMILTTFRFLDPVISPHLSHTIGTLFIGIIVGTIAVNWIGIIVYGLSIGINR